jgi:glycosyltransferase involved in cell wall biosynthesis
LRDLFPKWAADLGIIRRYGVTYFFFKYFEYMLYRSADYIGVQSPNNQLYFQRASYLKALNTEVLYNWTSIEKGQENDSQIREDLNLEDKIIFLYGGNIGVAQDIDHLLDLAKMLLYRKEIVFLLVGDGTEFRRLNERISNESIINTILLPSVSPEVFQGIVSASDVGLISLSKDLKTENFPGKIMSYMKSEKPMLASINEGNELFNIIHNNSGYVTLNGDHDLLLKYVLKMADDRVLREEMGENGFRFLQNQFNVESAVDRILNKINH